MFIVNQYKTRCTQLKEVKMDYTFSDLLNEKLTKKFNYILDGASNIKEDFELKRKYYNEVYPKMLEDNEDEVIVNISVNGVTFGSYTKREGECVYNDILDALRHSVNLFDMSLEES